MTTATTIKSMTIEALATAMNKQVWSKGDLKRIYLNDAGFNTKKMSTKTYVYQKDGEFKVSCKIECPSQDLNWIDSQEERVIEGIMTDIEAIIAEHGVEIENPQIAIEQKLSEEEQVQGYYTRWHSVRVAINSYGKLADRNRQKVHTYKGAASRAPQGFISLNNEHFFQATVMEERGDVFNFGETPSFKDTVAA